MIYYSEFNRNHVRMIYLFDIYLDKSVYEEINLHSRLVPTVVHDKMLPTYSREKFRVVGNEFCLNTFPVRRQWKLQTVRKSNW